MSRANDFYVGSLPREQVAAPARRRRHCQRRDAPDRTSLAALRNTQKTRMKAVGRLASALLLASVAAALPTSLLEDASTAQEAKPLRVAATTASPRAVGGTAVAQQASTGKTVAQYEKGYIYGTGKSALDKHVENALLKSELYGEPSAVNQYHYYGGAPPSKRSSGFRPMVPHALPLGGASPRLKRELDMDPEDFLALLSLWQAERRGNGLRSVPRWSRYGNSVDPDEYQIGGEMENEEVEDDDENNDEWLEGPVYSSALGPPHYSVDRRALQYMPPYGAYGQWGGFAKDKRFMVSRKRDVGGAPGGDIHYLAQLLGPAHHEPRLPLYHRVVL